MKPMDWRQAAFWWLALMECLTPIVPWSRLFACEEDVSMNRPAWLEWRQPDGLLAARSPEARETFFAVLEFPNSMGPNMAWNDGLVGRALLIAGAQTTPIRVMAGPGTGKSFCMKRRLMRLLEAGCHPSRMLVVTFTRMAASDLVREIEGLGVEGCEDIVASTLHSYCFRLLMKESVLEYTNRIPRPLVTFLSRGILQFEAAPLLQDLNSPTRFGNKRERTKRIRAFEASWARLQHDDPGWASDPLDAEFEEKLKEWLQFHRCMLIGELVPEALTFLRNNPTSSAMQVFDHELVDEYQDLNKAEQVLIDLLMGEGNLTVIGDADQSIYSFRYAHPTGIVEFGDTHPDTDDHELDECRRCPKRVVAMADCLIRRNHPPGSPPRLVARRANPVGEVHIVQWDSIAEETAGVAKFVTHLIDDRHFEPGEILVLCPRRLIGYAIRDALLEAGKPTHSFYHEEALEKKEAQEAFAFLTMLAHRSDRVALRFLLGHGSPTWLGDQYERVRQHCISTGMLPWNAMLRLATKSLTIPKTGNLQRRFAVISHRLREIKELHGRELVDVLFPEDAEWARVLREASLLTCDDETKPSDLLDDLRTRITQPEMPEEGDFVRIMSLHKSKGLQSRAVIVCGCVDGLVPFRDYDLAPEEQRESFREQRRLFYVAITRCAEILMLSSFRQIKASLAFKIGAKVTGRGLSRTAVASPFFNELGPSAPRPVRGDKFVY